MEEVSIIGIDLAKRSFQVHGAKADGSVADAEAITEAAQRPTMHLRGGQDGGAAGAGDAVSHA